MVTAAGVTKSSAGTAGSRLTTDVLVPAKRLLKSLGLYVAPQIT